MGAGASACAERSSRGGGVSGVGQTECGDGAVGAVSYVDEAAGRFGEDG